MRKILAITLMSSLLMGCGASVVNEDVVANEIVEVTDADLQIALRELTSKVGDLAEVSYNGEDLVYNVLNADEEIRNYKNQLLIISKTVPETKVNVEGFFVIQDGKEI